MIPAHIRASIEHHLRDHSPGAGRLVSAMPVSGGCISPAARIETDTGASYFVKWSRGDAPADFFAAEARSLEALRDTDAVRVPRVQAHHDAWILLEWLEPGAPTRVSWATLGRELAAMHRHRSDRNGWPADNYIGSLPQSNEVVENWPRFWAERRLLPQWAAVHPGAFDASDRAAFDRLIERLDDLLAPGNADGASILHGDLWGGNTHTLESGRIALIDPSTYHGHREVDLAMAELFGGFGPGFLDAYAEAWPIEKGYDVRRDVYQLYYLLVHVRLFGAGYIGGTRSILRRLGG